MKKGIKRACLTGLMSLAMITTAYSAEYISAESFANANGISHQWFPIQKMLIMRKGLHSIKFRIGETTAIGNEKEIKISGAPKIQNNQIMVPADALQSFFNTNRQSGTQSATNSSGLLSKPPTAVPNSQTIQNQQQNQLAAQQQAQLAAQRQAQLAAQQQAQLAAQQQAQLAAQQQAQLAAQQQAQQMISQPAMDGEAILLALRHSVREDHTRVVLEFSGNVTYKSEFKDGNYRLVINGCKNLVPAKRTNPVGRDIEKLDINSGADRKGLILSFSLTQKDKQPIIETVADPFRMIIQLPIGTPKVPEVATQTAVLAKTATATQLLSAEKVEKPVEMEKAPEINIEVSLEPLANSSFRGRTVIIDPGHGGMDNGFVFSGRPSEKVINFEIARLMKTELEKAGLRAVLLRTADVTMNYSKRLSTANKMGGDLFIAIHTGGSKDPGKNGVACYTYGESGTFYDTTTSSKRDAVYDEWLKGTRFDLAEFLAKKLDSRLTKHLQTDSRGVSKAPLLPLKFITTPAVLVEVGMLSDKIEGKNLISEKYRLAIAQSLTNGVVDFFNGIKMD